MRKIPHTPTERAKALHLTPVNGRYVTSALKDGRAKLQHLLPDLGTFRPDGFDLEDYTTQAIAERRPRDPDKFYAFITHPLTRQRFVGKFANRFYETIINYDPVVDFAEGFETDPEPELKPGDAVRYVKQVGGTDAPDVRIGDIGEVVEVDSSSDTIYPVIVKFESRGHDGYYERSFYPSELEVIPEPKPEQHGPFKLLDYVIVTRGYYKGQRGIITRFERIGCSPKHSANIKQKGLNPRYLNIPLTKLRRINSGCS